MFAALEMKIASIMQLCNTTNNVLKKRYVFKISIIA